MSKEEADEAVINKKFNSKTYYGLSQEKARREDQVRVELAIKESLKDAENAPPIPQQPEQPKKPQSNIDDLLNLGTLLILMTHNNDVFLDLAPEPVQQPQTNNFNPWGGAPAPAQPAADPFGAPSDPWGAPSSQPPPQPATSSAWGDPTPAPSTTAVAADPWGSSAPSSQAADPFGQASAFPPSNSSNGFGASPTDPFGAPAPAPANTQPPPAATDPFGQPTGKIFPCPNNILPIIRMV